MKWSFCKSFSPLLVKKARCEASGEALPDDAF